MFKYLYIVYYKKDGIIKYCMDSGELKFTTSIQRGHQYKETEYQDVINYLERTNLCKGAEIGYMKIELRLIEKHVTRNEEL